MISHKLKNNNKQHLESQKIVDDFLASGGKITTFAPDAISTNRYRVPDKPKHRVNQLGVKKNKSEASL